MKRPSSHIIDHWKQKRGVLNSRKRFMIRIKPFIHSFTASSTFLVHKPLNGYIKRRFTGSSRLARTWGSGNFESNYSETFPRVSYYRIQNFKALAFTVREIELMRARHLSKLLKNEWKFSIVVLILFVCFFSDVSVCNQMQSYTIR